jgi:hypothetical protein
VDTESVSGDTGSVSRGAGSVSGDAGSVSGDTGSVSGDAGVSVSWTDTESKLINYLFSRYELPQPGSAQKNDLGAWQESVDNSMAQLEHQANRCVIYKSGEWRRGYKNSPLASGPRPSFIVDF